MVCSCLTSGRNAVSSTNDVDADTKRAANVDGVRPLLMLWVSADGNGEQWEAYNIVSALHHLFVHCADAVALV